MQERSEAERRAIWPCLNVATWQRERSDRAVQRIKYDKIRPHSIPSLQFDRKVRPLSFRPENSTYLQPPPSRIENGSVANPGTAAEDAEELKTTKYVCLTDKGYIFQPLAFEIQGGVGPSTSTFLKNLCIKLCVCNQENRAGSFFGQRLSLAIQVGNAASVIGTVRDEDHLSELYYL